MIFTCLGHLGSAGLVGILLARKVVGRLVPGVWLVGGLCCVGVHGWGQAWGLLSMGPVGLILSSVGRGGALGVVTGRGSKGGVGRG